MTIYVSDISIPRTTVGFFTSRFTKIIFILINLYVFLAILLPAMWLAEVVRCIQITLSAVVVMGYWKPGTRCFYVSGRWPEKSSVVALGILVSWGSICASASWGLLWRLAGQPPWMVNNDFWTTWTAASSFAASLHIIAPNMVGVGIPEMDRRRYKWASAIGVVLVVVIGFWRPDLSGVAEEVRQWLDEPVWARDGLLRLMQSSHGLLAYLRGVG